jgi:membrane protein DedA with SNARE-associated domain
VFSQLTTWLVDTIGRMGYPGLVLLMAMESSVLPVPAELVMPPAGYLAAKGEMNVVLALVCGVVGSMLGAGANYWVSSHVGRWVFVRYGKWVLLSERSLEKTERFFHKHGEIATFVGRLFPVLRHLISIPAGLARMPLGKFFAYTASGATIWCAILLAIGWFIGKNEAALSHALVAEYSRNAVLVLLPVVFVLVAAYVWRSRRAMERV